MMSAPNLSTRTKDQQNPSPSSGPVFLILAFLLGLLPDSSSAPAPTQAALWGWGAWPGPKKGLVLQSDV